MIRSIIFNLIFWPAFLLYLLIMSPIVYFSSPKTTLKIGYRPVTWIMLFCMKYFANVNYEIKNKDKIPNGQVIVGCNHQSAWETFIFSILFDELAVVVKKELVTTPIAGLYIKRLDSIPVDRESPVKAIKTLMKFGKIAYQKGKSIVIFPNGTRSSADEQVEYKSGIFALYKTLGIPVVPAHVDSGEHWSRNAFKKIPGIITLEFKDPIQPGLSKDEFFKEFENRIDNC